MVTTRGRFMAQNHLGTGGKTASYSACSKCCTLCWGLYTLFPILCATLESVNVLGLGMKQLRHREAKEPAPGRPAQGQG